jgi:hypothetical protein
MIEVQLVNSVAPFCIVQPPFGSDEERQHRQKHIINVSAMEGKFTAISRKTDIWQKRL